MPSETPRTPARAEGGAPTTPMTRNAAPIATEALEVGAKASDIDGEPALRQIDKCVFDLVMRFGTSKSPKRTRSLTAYCAPTVLRSSRLRIAHCSYAARALLHHDAHNDSTACRMRSLYALHRSLSVAIPAIQPRLRLSGTTSLRFAYVDSPLSTTK